MVLSNEKAENGCEKKQFLSIGELHVWVAVERRYFNIRWSTILRLHQPGAVVVFEGALAVFLPRQWKSKALRVPTFEDMAHRSWACSTDGEGDLWVWSLTCSKTTRKQLTPQKCQERMWRVGFLQFLYLAWLPAIRSRSWICLQPDDVEQPSELH